MERRSSLARRAALAGTALLLLVGLTGCNGKAPVGRGPVATVNDHEITLDDLRAVTESQLAYLEGVRTSVGSEQSEAQGVDAAIDGFLGDGERTLGTDGAAQMLGLMIQVELMEDLVEAEGITVTAEDRTNAQTQVDQRLEQYGLTDSGEVAAVVDYELRYRVALAALQRGIDVTEVLEQQARDLYEQNRDLFEDSVCIQQLITADEATARAAIERIDAGEDFAAVAQAVSQNPELAVEGDDTMCIPRENLRGVFPDETATVGEGDVIGPADGDGAWITVRVWDERSLDFESVREELIASVGGDSGAADAAVEAKITDHFTDASVTVDPRYGTWDPVTGSVSPPADPLAVTDDPFVVIDG